ncbi:MAG: hypothetical protein EHM36_07420 [Deltaproteobacteria bacterium]|nr:MAG: hypothetical protein EHM36_07420 [Deltaproteobacteria bacterium]
MIGSVLVIAYTMSDEKVMCKKCKKELTDVIRLFMVRMTWDEAEQMYAPKESEPRSDLVDFCPHCGKGVAMERVHGNS